jgi:predicted acyltransferase (DUF342 family)
MAKIANVALTNTFDTWRIRSNQSFNRLSQFAIDESKLYANTLTANVRFVSLGATKLGDANNDTTIINGALTANGRVTISSNMTVGGNTTTNKLTVTSSLASSGNTTLGDAAADRLTLNGNTVTMGAAVLNIDTGLLFLQRNSNRVGVNTLQPNTAFHVNGVVLANSGYKYPDGALTTAPLYVYDSSGTQLYP